MKHQQVQHLLIQLRYELKAIDLWQAHPPATEALQSTQPFAVDTLSFHQWLQFIMIPRMEALIADQQPLPSSMAVSPMAAQVYKGQLKEHRKLIACLRELDVVVSGVDPMQAS